MDAVKPLAVHVTTLHPVFDIRIFRKECRTLADGGNGYDVTLIAPHEFDETVDGVKIRAIQRYTNRFMRMTIGGWRAYKLARSSRADAYHFHDPELLPWMALLKRHAAVIYDVHENLPKAILTKNWIPKALRPLVSNLSRSAERFCARGMRLVLAETSYEPDYAWAPAITVLNMPIVDELLAIDAQKHLKPTVGYLGAVNASRGSINTVRALGLLKEEGLDIAFKCVGPVSDAHRGELVTLASQLGVEIAVPGYTPAQRGWKTMAQCNVGLALLHPQPNYIESYPTKLFEYMALGLPMIASDFPLYRDLVEGNGCGLCVDPLDSNAIAQALRSLLTAADPSKVIEMGERGREAVKRRYSWDSEAEKLLALYGQLVGE